MLDKRRTTDECAKAPKQKLKVATIAVIKVNFFVDKHKRLGLNSLKAQNKQKLSSKTIRVFVKEYNKHERTYLVLLLEDSLRFSIKTKGTLLVREKAIIEVIERVDTGSNLLSWKDSDVLQYLQFEIDSIHFAAYSEKRKTNIGDVAFANYVEHFKYFRKSPNPNRLRGCLKARSHYFTSRLVPTHMEKVSRTVARRLRRKSDMRNSHSSRSYRKRKVHYVMAKETKEKFHQEADNVSNKGAKDSKVKGTLIAPMNSVTGLGTTLGKLPGISGNMENVFISGSAHDITASAFIGGTSNKITKITPMYSTKYKKGKQRKKKLGSNIPF